MYLEYPIRQSMKVNLLLTGKHFSVIPIVKIRTIVPSN